MPTRRYDPPLLIPNHDLRCDIKRRLPTDFVKDEVEIAHFPSNSSGIFPARTSRAISPLLIGSSFAYHSSAARSLRYFCSRWSRSDLSHEISSRIAVAAMAARIRERISSVTASHQAKPP